MPKQPWFAAAVGQTQIHVLFTLEQPGWPTMVALVTIRSNRAPWAGCSAVYGNSQTAEKFPASQQVS